MDVWSTLKTNIEGYWDILILSIPKIAVSLLIVGFFFLVALSISKILRAKIGKTSDSITVNFIVRLIKSVMMVTGLILGLHALGFESLAGGLLASAGVGAIIFGFAFKEIGENFLAGIILVFDRPFNIGDTVSVNGNMGNVVQLKFRTTQIKSFDGKDIYVPNGAVIRNDLYNYTRDGFLRIDFMIGVDYDDDLNKAIKLVTDKVNSYPEILRSEQTQVIVNDFGTNTVNLKIMFWIDTYDYKVTVLDLKSKIMVEVKNLLMEQEFGLPANIQEIKMYRPDPIPIIVKKEAS